jgi:hypothetical protein
MTDVPSICENISKHVPWNKGKIVGAKSRLSGRCSSGTSGPSFRSKVGRVIWRFSTLPLTANFVAAT